MSVTNFINSDDFTIVQGVNGIRLCQESWMSEKAALKEIITLLHEEDEKNSMETDENR